MKTYTTMDAIGDIFVIYGIVIVVSMLVAVVIRGIVWALSRSPTETAPKQRPNPRRPCNRWLRACRRNTWP